MPKPLQPNFILDVEMSELFIQAGLQDRVIQVSITQLTGLQDRSTYRTEWFGLVTY